MRSLIADTYVITNVRVRSGDLRPCLPRRWPKQCSNCLRVASVVGLAFATSSSLADAPAQRLNPVIGLIEQGKPVMGLYAPSNRKPPGAAADAPTPKKTPAELAKETVSYKLSDFVFDGSMEHKSG